jgi:hypothetical protein
MKTYNLIKSLLTKYPELRNNDKLLHWKVFEVQGLLVNNCLPMNAFIYKAKSTETIRRTRQMIQAKYPSLQANELVKQNRAEVQRSKGTWCFHDNIATFIVNE